MEYTVGGGGLPGGEKGRREARGLEYESERQKRGEEKAESEKNGDFEKAEKGWKRKSERLRRDIEEQLSDLSEEEKDEIVGPESIREIDDPLRLEDIRNQLALRRQAKMGEPPRKPETRGEPDKKFDYGKKRRIEGLQTEISKMLSGYKPEEIQKLIDVLGMDPTTAADVSKLEELKASIPGIIASIKSGRK